MTNSFNEIGFVLNCHIGLAGIRVFNNFFEGIKKSIESIEQITKVDVNVADHSAMISMGDHVQTDEMQSALDEIGDYQIGMDMNTMKGGKKIL